MFETRYVITLDRLERYCPEWLTKNIDTIVKKQRQEWKDLGLGDYAKSADLHPQDRRRLGHSGH